MIGSMGQWGSTLCPHRFFPLGATAETAAMGLDSGDCASAPYPCSGVAMRGPGGTGLPPNRHELVVRLRIARVSLHASATGSMFS